MSPEPIVCLDGDAAGQKAASRAADLALPHIQPERSLRFAFLPTGLDPDDLIRRDGSDAMRKVLKDTSPLIDVLWRRERNAEPLDTPERKAGLERRLATIAKRIADPAVSAQYGQALRALAKDALWHQRGGGQGASARRDARGLAKAAPDWRTRELAQARRKPGLPPPQRAAAREELLRHGVARLQGEVGLAREAIILRTLLNHPHLLDDIAEEIADIKLSNPELAGLRDAILGLHSAKSPLDSDTLATHLNASGHQSALGLIARAITHKAVRFCERDATDHDVRMGLRDALVEQHRAELLAALKAAEHHYMEDGSETAWAQLLDIQARLRANHARVSAEPGNDGI
jgi:DNA primase